MVREKKQCIPLALSQDDSPRFAVSARLEPKRGREAAHEDEAANGALEKKPPAESAGDVCGMVDSRIRKQGC